MRALLAIAILVGTIVLAVGTLITARQLFYIVDSYRYRLTVNFVVDGRTLSASGVIQETLHRPPCFPLEGGSCVHRSVKGQAIPIVFPNGKVAFVLLEVVDTRATFLRSASWALPASPTGKKSAWMNREFPVSVQLLPTIVYFPDTNDPYSLTIVDPRNISEVGGPGATYTGASVTVTDEKVTRGIERYLPWINTFKVDPSRKNIGYYQFGIMTTLVRHITRNDL